MLDGRDASAAHAVAANLGRWLRLRRGRERAHFVSAESVCRTRVACAAALMMPLLGLIFVGSAAANGAPLSHLLHVRGSARIDAHVARSQGKLILSGAITDDVGAAVDHPRVAVRIAQEGLPSSASLAPAADARATALSRFLPAAVLEPEACSDAGQAPAIDGTDRLLPVTDSAARFCLRIALPAGRYVARIEATDGGFVDGARIDVPLDLALEPVTLRFDPERALLSLDDESNPVEVVATTEDDGVIAAATNLPLTLFNESGETLGDATTDGSGRTRFVVRGALFGPPGPGELRVSFAGSADVGASSHDLAIERTTRVELDAPEATGGRLPLATAERELALRVVARTTCATRGCSGTATGTVEVRQGDGDRSRIAGAAALAGGEARIVVTLAAPRDGRRDSTLILDYVPDAPWFESAGPLRLTQPLRPPGAWDEVLLALTGLGVVGWLGVGRLPSRVEGRAGSSGSRKSGARVELVSAAATGAPLWTGRVVDGHEGSGIAGARVAIERPGFDRAETLAEATSDAHGAFVLGPATVQPGDRLLAEGPLHAGVRVPAPPFGDIRVGLFSRKRVLLDRLVGWARRKGRPFDAQPDPTPGHVKRMAGSGSAVNTWAEAVERAAYGGAPVDAEREAEVDRLAPEDPSPVREPSKATRT